MKSTDHDNLKSQGSQGQYDSNLSSQNALIERKWTSKEISKSFKGDT